MLAPIRRPDLPVTPNASTDLTALSVIQIQRLTAQDAGAAARWDAFVLACPQATFFHRAGWQHIIERVFKHETYFLMAVRDGAIEGVLPLARIKSLLFGHSLVGLPFTVYGGVAALNEDAAGALEAEAQRIAQATGVEHLELRNVQRRPAQGKERGTRTVPFEQGKDAIDIALNPAFAGVPFAAGDVRRHGRDLKVVFDVNRQGIGDGWGQHVDLGQYFNNNVAWVAQGAPPSVGFLTALTSCCIRPSNCRLVRSRRNMPRSRRCN